MPALDILGVLLDDKDLCYSAIYEPYHMMKELHMYDRLPCPNSERGLLLWRVTCIGKMIMASDVTAIMDETIK